MRQQIFISFASLAICGANAALAQHHHRVTTRVDDCPNTNCSTIDDCDASCTICQYVVSQGAAVCGVIANPGS